MTINTFRSVWKIINYKTIIVTVLAVASTYICSELGMTAHFPDMMVGVAIVFPVVFSIGSAYSRRETALQRLSEFKGNAATIFYATRDWNGKKDQELAVRCRTTIHSMMVLMKHMFKTKDREAWAKDEKQMYVKFSELSELLMNQSMMIQQIVGRMILAFDNMKIYHEYRTPITLRAYSRIFLYIFPIVYGPYFAANIKDFSEYLEYVMPVLYSFILVGLDNIQGHLENPFDGVGEDDIEIDSEHLKDLLH
jgi:hypothetical protein